MNNKNQDDNFSNASVYLKYEIIIVEDNLLVSGLIQKRFSSDGIKFKVAANGKDALEKISRTNNEILLLDYKLPDINGGELVEILRDKYSFNPNFIIMTGFGDEQIAVQMMKLGARDYIIKTNGFIDILSEIIKRVCTDIEKEKKLKETQSDLIKNYELLNETGRLARIGGWESDLTSDRIIFTQTVKNILKVPHDYLPKTEEFILFVSPEYRHVLKRALNLAIKQGESFNLELQLVSKKANNLWVNIIGKPEIKDGKCVRLNGTFQDISHIKTSENLIQKIDEKNKFLLKIAEDLLAIKNLPELYEYVSEKIYELIDRKGYVRVVGFNTTQTKWEVRKIKGLGNLVQKIQKIAGINIENIKGGLENENTIKNLENRKLKKTAFNFNDLTQGAINQKQGETIKKLLGIKSLYSIPLSQDNKYMGVVNIATKENIYPENTELIEALVNEVSLSIDKFTAQEALNNKLREIELITKNIPNVIWKVTFDANDNIQSVYISDVVDEFLKLPPGSIKNKWDKIFQYIKPEYIPPLKVKFYNALKTPDKPFTFEFEVVKEDGGSGWLLASGRAYKENDGISFYGYVTDISDLKRNELELIEAKDKAEESDRLKSAFLANISHEIRTPMNSIFGAVSILKERNLEGSEKMSQAEEHEFHEIIFKSGSRMLDTVKNIIDISKIETEQVEINFESFNICEEFRSICEKHIPDVHAKGLEFINKNSLPHEVIKVNSDKDKLNSIFNNLFGNAVKFTNEGFIEVGCTKKDDNLMFFVKDSGIGISEKRLHAIFNPFEQADLNLTRGHEGAGLGLSIAKSYINLLGGEIWVESKKGKGATFFFTLPIKDNATDENENNIKTTAKADQKRSSKNGNDITILLVEDDEIGHKLMLKRLHAITNKVISAYSGTEAVEVCRRNPEVDIILMDIKMPKMDGYEATKQIRTFNSTVPVIAQTAYALLGDKEKAFDAGFDDYLSKPINNDHLIALINKYSKKSINC